jgi:hypothetical protein
MSEQETARCFYTAMRTEINQHLLIVNQIYTLYFAGITALFAAALSKEGHRYLLLLIPFLSLGVANMIGTHERVIGGIAAYCVQELDPAFKRNGNYIVQWDNSDVLKQLAKSHYESNRAGSLTLIVLPGAGALLISITLKLYSQKGWIGPLQTHPLWPVAWLTCLLCLAAAATIIIKTAQYRRKVGNMQSAPKDATTPKAPRRRRFFPFILGDFGLCDGPRIRFPVLRRSCRTLGRHCCRPLRGKQQHPAAPPTNKISPK